MTENLYPIVLSSEEIQQSILFVRGQKVMLDKHLAMLYGVQTKVLLQSIKRNSDRFPTDFMFQLTPDEFQNLRSHAEISKRGGRRYQPYAFTEQGVAMLSSVLNSKQAIQVNIEIMRAFVNLRQVVSSHKELQQKLQELEKKCDKKFNVVFEAIRQLMMPPEPPKKRPIGFHAWKDE
ncbi:MAG TPA: ORF6N domain-containing protein [Gammaproteobacteria bacterium]|nr:ORF6N domain-containing protein [Gammaproteobacteria bacterium]